MIKQIPQRYAAAELEAEVQRRWAEEHAYEKAKERRSAGERFYFLDGPPYTTGSIHLGTAMNKTVKDILIRYWRMRGYNVRDQPGFDMHGLPIEVKVEKKIGVHSKKQIEEEIGIDTFVRACQEFAYGLHASMTEQFKQLGVWMDWDHPYQTLDPDYMESAWWTARRAYEGGLLKDSSRVVTWCPRCETALAEAEIDYSDETDPSVMVRFPLADDPSVSLLIWTTTPWTLPSNMAVAVHPDEAYVKARMSGDAGSETVVVMRSQAEHVMREGGYSEFEILEERRGRELVGLRYRPPFEIGSGLRRTGSTFTVVGAAYVERGNTGLVHTAPGFGPDDFETGRRCGLVPFCPVDEAGRFTQDFPMMAGKKVRTCNEDIIAHLREEGLLYAASRTKHRYGHCWRCKNPIIYRNTRQWFIDVPRVKEAMTAEVDRAKWVPDWAGESREKNWVDNARDWCISRQRYWGIPLPIWECGCGERRVVGQYAELREGEGYTEGMDTHRPWIDEVTFRCPRCGGAMRRVPDVMDVWFDSGVAAWASFNYPRRKEEFERWWPGRFIVEAHDQTRGWFYTQLAAGVVSFGRAPYDEVMMHGWMLDSKGRKMSKSLGNVVEPLEVISQYGADALRYYMVSANAPWDDTAYQASGPKDAWKMLNTFWNVVNFAAMYMSMDGYEPREHTLAEVRPYLRGEDLWMLSRTERMKRAVTESMESRELHRAARALAEYIVEDLSRWYLHLVRDRSWDEGASADKTASYFMLHRSITGAALCLAPICPHIAEEVYRAMGGAEPSVHMEDWPAPDMSLADEGAEHSMALVQNIIEVVAAERARMKSKLRWPLKAVHVRGRSDAANDAVRAFEGILAQQGNIKAVSYLPAHADLGGEGIDPVPFAEGDLFIDFEITPEIEAEGYARELIRRIQQMRKDMKLDVEDYINVDVMAEDRLVELFRTWEGHIRAEVRARQISYSSDNPAGDEVREWDVTGRSVTIGVTSARI